MSPDARKPSPPLTLIKGASSAAASAAVCHETKLEIAGPDRDIDWSILMARAQEGDGNAYRRLLNEITPYLRSFAARYHRDPRDIEDSMQDTLLTLHAIRHTYDPRRPFTPWLVAITRRRIIDRLRQQKRSRSREARLEPEHETFAAPETNLSETASDARALRQAVEGLPPGQREAVKLLKLEEMSLKEAARISGLTVAALKVATHRAITNLRQKLRNWSREA